MRFRTKFFADYLEICTKYHLSQYNIKVNNHEFKIGINIFF